MHVLNLPEACLLVLVVRNSKTCMDVRIVMGFLNKYCGLFINAARLDILLCKMNNICIYSISIMKY